MKALLAADEPAPVLLERDYAASPFVLTCDHAGKLIPRSLGDLGVAASERERHIAWDIGALGVARELSARLDAVLIAQLYSRLVIDCNRPLDSDELIPLRSEATDIPGNCALDIVARRQRQTAIYEPYHAAIRALLERRAVAGRETVFVSVHSFTPVYLGRARAWQVGVLYGRDDRLARPVLEQLRAGGDFYVGDNQPYRIDDKDEGIPAHAQSRGLLNVLFEIRQDLIARPAQQQVWGQRLAAVLRSALGALRI